MDLTTVLDQLRGYGLRVESVTRYGEIVRVPVDHPRPDKGGKKSGWYVIHEVHLRSGGIGYAGAYGNWKSDSDSQSLSVTPGPLSDEDRAEFRRQQEAARQAAREERERQATECAQRAQQIWSNLPAGGACPYLQRKRVRNHGTRFARGKLVVPLHRFDEDGPHLVGLQFVAEDGSKKFLTGTPKRGACHLIGDITQSPLVIVEGYATGASIHEATGYTVAVAFDAGNLEPVARALHAAFRDALGDILVAGDDDAQTPGNPGRNKAISAASAVGGRWVVPDCSALSGEGLTDFNDLCIAAGSDALKAQIQAALESDPADPGPPPGTPPAPSDGGAGERPTLEQALRRFALIFGETKVYDYDERQVLRKTAVRDLMGKELFGEWMEHDDRRTVTWDTVKGYQDPHDPRQGLLERFTLVYPSRNVWDQKLRQIVSLDAVKALLPKDFTWWAEHSRRRVVHDDQIVFDPTERSDPNKTINTFTGLPLQPASSPDACQGILQTLDLLCNQDSDALHWVLCWLAYPLQHVGAKLDTALLFHSEVQGSGKSLFFGEVMTRLYGEYASVLGQHQLESQYTDWRSRLLYAVFEEVLSRTEKHNQMGTIKHMITGQTQRIERKFVAGWEEANFMNGVFLSNEIQPFPLDPSDRRFMVAWPRHTLPDELQHLVEWELERGGPEAMYRYLLDYRVTGFGPHSKPPDTDAKRRLIDFSLPNFEVFWREWRDGELDAPFISCTTRDLYQVYRRWCTATGNKAMSETKLLTILGTRITKDTRRFRIQGIEHRKRVFIIGEPPSDDREAEWLGRSVAEFRQRSIPMEDAG